MFSKEILQNLWNTRHPSLSSPEHTLMKECPPNNGQRSQHNAHPFFALNFNNSSLTLPVSGRNNLPNLLITSITLPGTSSVELQILINLFELPLLQQGNYIFWANAIIQLKNFETYHFHWNLASKLLCAIKTKTHHQNFSDWFEGSLHQRANGGSLGAVTVELPEREKIKKGEGERKEGGGGRGEVRAVARYLWGYMDKKIVGRIEIHSNNAHANLLW